MAALQFALNNISEADLGKATPCSEFSVSGLLDHLGSSVSMIGGALGAAVSDDPSLAPEARIANLAQPTLEAFAARGVEGEIDLGFAVMPASVVAGILNLELMVHGWDFAQATGQVFEIHLGHAEYVLGLARKTVGPAPAHLRFIRRRNPGRRIRQQHGSPDCLHRSRSRRSLRTPWLMSPPAS